MRTIRRAALAYVFAALSASGLAGCCHFWHHHCCCYAPAPAAPLPGTPAVSPATRP